MKAPTHDNDNSDTWIELAAATANLVRYLQGSKEKRPDSEREENPDSDVDKKREHERFVETRLREIERFERRFRSGQDRTRR